MKIPKGTIHGLGSKDEATARSSVSKIRKSGRSSRRAHKIQAQSLWNKELKPQVSLNPSLYIEKKKKKYINSCEEEN